MRPPTASGAQDVDAFVELLGRAASGSHRDLPLASTRMRTYLDSTNRAAVRWGLALGGLLAVVGLVLRPVAIGVAVGAFLAAFLCLGVAAYAWLDDVTGSYALRRRARRR